MTRTEKQKKKLEDESAFIESIKGIYLSSELKEKFRKTLKWKDFKKGFLTEVDVISLKKLPKRWQLHHMDLDPSHYTDLKKDKFVPLNGLSHKMVHYLYSIYRNDKDVLKRLKKILDKMDRLNNGMDILDYKKLLNKNKADSRKRNK